MSKKLISLILTACMILSLFTGLPAAALDGNTGFENETEDVITGGQDVALLGTLSGGYNTEEDTSGSDIYGLEDDTDVYSNKEDTSEITLQSSSSEADRLGITRYLTNPDLNSTFIRAELAEMIAGYLYNGSIPLENYTPKNINTFGDGPFNELTLLERNAIFWCADQLYTVGYDNIRINGLPTFQPEVTVQSWMAALVYTRIIQSFVINTTLDISALPVNDPNAWYLLHIQKLYNLGLIDNIDTGPWSSPQNEITYNEFIQGFINTLKYIVRELAYDYDITGYSYVTVNNETVTRAQAAVLIAGLKYDSITPLSEYVAVKNYSGIVDLPSDTITKNAIFWCMDKGYMQGVDSTHVAPGDNLTKRQAAALLFRVMGRKETAYLGTSQIADVDITNLFYKQIMTLYDLKIINTESGNIFEPNAPVSGFELLSWLINVADAGETYEADSLGITRYTAGKIQSPIITRAQMAELVAGCMYEGDLNDYTPVNPNRFNDVYAGMSDTMAYKAILWCADMNYVSGNREGNFLPNNTLSRADASVIIYRMRGIEDSGYFGGCHFDDVNSDAYYYQQVMNLYELGIVTPVSNNKFLPTKPVSGAAILQWLVNMKHFRTERTVLDFNELCNALIDPVVQSITVTRDITVPEGATLTINKNVSIYGWRSLAMNNCNVEVNSGVTLTLSGSDAGGSLVDSGQLKIKNGGTLICNQNLNINANAAFTVEEGGKVIVKAGKNLFINGNTTINGTIQLNAGEGTVLGAELTALNSISGSGAVIGYSSGANKGTVRANEDYSYNPDGSVTKIASTIGDSITVDTGLVKAPIKAVTVDNTNDFNSALTDGNKFLFINVTGTEVVAGTMAAIDNYKHIYVLPDAKLTFSDSGNNIVIPSKILISLMYSNDGGYESNGTVSVSTGCCVTVKSDWSIIGRYDINGIEFQNKGSWNGTFGGVIGGYNDDTDDGITNPTFRVNYFSREGNPGYLIENCALSISRVEYLYYGGSINAALTPIENGPASLTIGALYVGDGASLTINEGFTLNVSGESGSGWRSVNDDNKYGRDFYYVHSAEPGYVQVGSGSRLYINGTLNNSTAVTWTEIIRVDNTDGYNIGENRIAYIGAASKYTGYTSYSAIFSPQDLIVVYSGISDTWSGAIDINGGFMSVGTTGYVRAEHIWLGINSWNIEQPGCGFASESTSVVKLDGWFGRSIIESLTVDELHVDGDINIEPGCTLNVKNLEVTNNLCVYGELNLTSGGTVTAGFGIHKMYYYDKQINSYVSGALSDNIASYYVGVSDENALKNLLDNTSINPADISILFNWYIGNWSQFAADNPNKTVTIDANIYTQNTLQVYDGFTLNINGTLSNSNYIRADNSYIRAESIINNQYGNLEAVNNGRIISSTAYNSGNIYGNNGGQVWFTVNFDCGGNFNSVYYNGISARYLNWDNGTPCEDTNYNLENKLFMQKNTRSFLFYYMTYNTPTTENPLGSWTLTPIPAADLALKNGSGGTVSGAIYTLVEQDNTYVNFTGFTPPYWGKYIIEYNDGSKIHTMDVSVALPEVGFYSEPYRYEEAIVSEGVSVEGLFVKADGVYTAASGTAAGGVVYYSRSYGASEEFWIDNFGFTPRYPEMPVTEKFYLIYDDTQNPGNYAGDCVKYNAGSQVICKEIYRGDSKVWELYVKDGTWYDFNLNMGAEIFDSYGNRWTSTSWLNLTVENYEHLVWLHDDSIRRNRFDENVLGAHIVIGDEWYGAFYLYCYDEISNKWVYKPVSSDNLQVNGEPLSSCTGLSFIKSGAAYFNLKFNAAGGYHVTYHEGTATCPYGVGLNIDYLPDIGVYKSPAGGKNNYINNWDMNFVKYRTVYLIPANGFELSDMDLSETRIGAGANGSWEEKSFGNGNASLTIDNFCTVTAVNANPESDNIYDYFKVEMLANPFIGGMSLYISLKRASNGYEFYSNKFNFNSNLERADSIDSEIHSFNNNSASVTGITDKTVKIYKYTVQNGDQGWYSFKLSGSDKDGNYGLFTFGSDWGLKDEYWGYVDNDSNYIRNAANLAAGTYYIAVFDRTDKEGGGNVSLTAVKSSQPAAPTTSNAKLCLEDDFIYSIRLTKGETDVTEYAIYAKIGGVWRDRGTRTLWYDVNRQCYNDEYCYLADIMSNGETATAFGVKAVNGDGVKSENMLVLTPDHPVTRNDSDFDNIVYNITLTRLPNNELTLTAMQGEQQVVFKPKSASRFYHEVDNGDWTDRNCDIGFGCGNNRAELNSYNDKNLAGLTNGCWVFEVSGQYEASGAAAQYIVGWSKAARINDNGSGTGKIGSIKFGSGSKTAWIVQDWGDLSNASYFRYNSGMSYWYTKNSAKLWMVTWSEEEGYSYTEITSHLKIMRGNNNISTALGLDYKKEFGRWDFNLSAMNAGDTFRFVYTDVGGNELASMLVTVVKPDGSFYTSSTPSKESLCGGNLLSTQNEVFFVWDEQFERDRGFTSCDIQVFRPVMYDPAIQQTYYRRDDSNGRYYIVTDGFDINKTYYVEDTTLASCDMSHFTENYLIIHNLHNKGDFELGIVFKIGSGTNTTVADYRSIWVQQVQPYIVDITYGSGKLSLTCNFDNSFIDDKLIAASYFSGKMIETRMVTLDSGLVNSTSFEISLAWGDTYKVFILSGDGKFTPIAFFKSSEHS